MQRGFYRIASVLGQSLSRSATLDAVAQAAAEALGGASAAVLMPHARRLALAGSHELPADSRRLLEDGIEEGDGPLARAARQGRVIAAPTLADDDRLPEGWRAAASRRLSRAPRGARRDAARATAGGLVVVFFDGGARLHATTISSSRAISPTRRAARSSAASSSRPSAAPARSPSS